MKLQIPSLRTAFESKAGYQPLAEPISSDDDSRRLSWSSQQSPNSPISEKRGQYLAPSRRTSRCVYIFLAILAIPLLLSLGILVGWKMAESAGASGRELLFSDRVIPLTTKHVTFTDNATFMADPTTHPEVEEAWSAQMPRGRGGILLSPPEYPPENIDLPRAVDNQWGISMYHSLHCLWMIHRTYHSYLRAEHSDAAEGGGLHLPHAHAKTHDSDGHVINDHITHCIDYLRQGVLCAADTTFEPTDFAGGSSGVGVVHVCRDFEALYTWADGEDRRAGEYRGVHGGL
ncbi:hypothetical protein BDW74DRAFT_175105 [Aspergillus multicolor]|uniref:uncharacterized protein n=1 Tax=Aspergillus multicolor TaxID=41759 RepID=UPI003CCDEDDA